MIPAKHTKIFQIITLSIIKARERGKKDTRCYLVGGYVRDYLIGKEPKDIDCVCNNIDDVLAELETILNAKNIHFKKQVYQAFGTRLYHFLEENVEFVLPRRESYREYTSRNPEIKEGTFKDDAFRRDFTVNAIYLSLNPEDYLKPVDLTKRGISDLKKMVLDTPLDPSITFNEDPLRMLRLARFYAVKGFKPVKRVVESCKKNANRLSIIKIERVEEEIMKSIVSPTYFEVLYELGLLFIVFPELKNIEGLKQEEKWHKNDVLIHTFLVVRCLPPIMRLAGLYHDTGKIIIKKTGTFYEHEKLSVEFARSRLHSLKFPKEIIDYTTFIIKNHMRLLFLLNEEQITSKATRRFMKEFGDKICDLITFFKCDIYGDGVNIKEQIQKLETFMQQMKNVELSCPVPQKLAIDGNDVMRVLDLKHGGEIVGRILHEIMQKVVDQEIQNEKMILIEHVKTTYKK